MTSTTRYSGTSFHILRRNSGGNFGKSSNLVGSSDFSSGAVEDSTAGEGAEEVASVILDVSRRQVNVPNGLEDWKTLSCGQDGPQMSVPKGLEDWTLSCG